MAKAPNLVTVMSVGLNRPAACNEETGKLRQAVVRTIQNYTMEDEFSIADIVKRL